MGESEKQPVPTNDELNFTGVYFMWCPFPREADSHFREMLCLSGSIPLEKEVWLVEFAT